MLDALRGRAADEGGDRAPLGRHELGEVEKALLLVSRPFRLSDARVEPLVPPGLGLRARGTGGGGEPSTGRNRLPRGLTCLHVFLGSSDETRAHWFMPYFMTAALRISSSLFFHTPPLIIILILGDS